MHPVVILLLLASLVGARAEEIVFAVRQPKGPHWYENFGHTVRDEQQAVYGAGGRLCILTCGPLDGQPTASDERPGPPHPALSPRRGTASASAWPTGGSPSVEKLADPLPLPQGEGRGEGEGRVGMAKVSSAKPATGTVRILVNDPHGAVRDPQVHYDARKILFSYRKGGSPYYHLYEINTDGTGLKQLTDGPFDDLEPSYLPDGGIVFCSSRCNRFVPCWYVQVAILYRCDGDGKNIRPLSSNIEQDNTPWVLPDGRILYTRWEYVDRSREHFHHLWVMNPDGTGQMTFFGNQNPGDVFLDAKPISNDRVVMVNSPNHGRQEHEGRIAIVSTAWGPDAPQAQVFLSPTNNFRDPYPLSANQFLVAQENRLVLITAPSAATAGILSLPLGGEGRGEGDARGLSPPITNNDRVQARELYRLNAELAQGGNWIHEPRPLRPRPREPVIPPRVNVAETNGELIVMDIYQGRNMAGIQRGAIKKLLVLENLPKPVNYTGSMDPISYGGSYTLNRVLGTVPVEADGSVHFKAPALRSLQLVALDENDLSVKRMLSFMTVMPGERTSCTGCHEDRAQALPVRSNPLALQRPPSAIAPIPGTPEIFDYPRDIQPIWDKHCVKCHDETKYDGRALLTGDQGPMFSHSYFTLSARLQIADGRDLARGNYAPYTIGSAASPLLDKLVPSHYDVKLSSSELRQVKLWIDASATYPGTYAALGSGMIGPYAALEYGTKPKVDYLNWPGLKAAREVLQRRCAACHTGDRKLPAHPADTLGLRLHHLAYDGGKPRFWEPPWLQTRPRSGPRPGSIEWMQQHADPRLQFSHNILYNFTRPEKSLQLLAPLAKSAGGHATCGEVFANTHDPDYQLLLAGIREAKAHLAALTHFTQPNFRPEPEYIREMKRYGVLPATFQPGDPIDVYATDRRYWESLWPRP